MPLPPYPVMPAPRTWSRGDKLLTPLLRNDLTNAALLLANRPLFVASQSTTGQSLAGSTLSLVDLDTEYVDTWNRHQIPNPQWPVPLGGWYLIEGDNIIGVTANTSYAMTGFQVTHAGSNSNVLTGTSPNNGTTVAQPTGAYLAQLDPTTGDQLSLLGYQSSASAVNIVSARLKAEWVAQPTSLGYGTGTVVTSPQPAAIWAPGGGTTITVAAATGAISLQLASVTGIVPGGYIGLEYYEGTPVSPMAEVVQVQTITGNTVFLNGTTVYPHGPGVTPGLVAVPVSSAWMNQQCRDLINFLAYPPIANLWGGTGSLAAQTWPAATAISFGSATVDNFGGWNSASEYVFPVSGLYYVYGQVSAVAATTVNISAGLGVSAGTIQWGNSVRPLGGSQQTTATVRRHLRVTAGEYVQLFGSASAAVSLNTSAFTSASRLIVVFRGF